MMSGYKDTCLSCLKSDFINSPNETTKMILLDDSGYVSPEFLHLSPFHLEGHHKSNIQEASRKVLSNQRKFVHTLTPHQKCWEEPEEEDVTGKMLLRKDFPMCRNDIQLDLCCWDFPKRFAEMYDNENIIGKRIGRQNCNIISKLYKRNVTDFITKLMAYMPPKDVSK